MYGPRSSRSGQNGGAWWGTQRHPQDYQDLPQSLTVMPKWFADGFFIAPHNHPRDQLIYAIAGVVRIETADDAWVAPPDRALLMPAGKDHGIQVLGDVEMRTLYIAPSETAEIKVLSVTAVPVLLDS